MSESGNFPNKLLDQFYPSACALCDEVLAGGRSLCGSCAEGMPEVAAPFCEVCSEPFTGQIDGAFVCPNCDQVSFHFEFARCAMARCDGLLGMIHELKYAGRNYLATELGLLACRAFQDRRLAIARDEGWVMVPVPLHWRRLRIRQFNQAEEIAKVIAKESGLQVSRMLRRSEPTATQTRLSRRERMANLKNAFSLGRFVDGAAVASHPGIILVDDVLTTGSTVDACAKVLRRAGAKRVAVLTVMRG